MSDKLDNVLQDWAARKKSPEEHLMEIASRIRTEAARERYCKETNSAVVPFWSKLGYAGLGAVVTLIVSLFYIHSLAPVRLPSSGNGSAAKLAAIPSDRVEIGMRLFDEMEKMFSDRLRWICDSNGDIGLGIETTSGGIDVDSPAMLVRLTVVVRRIGEKAWKSAWSTDVMLRGEEMVEIVPDREKDTTLALWVYPLADGKIAVDTSLSLEMPIRQAQGRPVQLASMVNTVVEQGEPLEVASLRTGDMEYRVFQTVKALRIAGVRTG